MVVYTNKHKAVFSILAFIAISGLYYTYYVLDWPEIAIIATYVITILVIEVTRVVERRDDRIKELRSMKDGWRY